MNGTNETYAPTSAPSAESSSFLIVTDDEIDGIRPRFSDRSNYGEFIFSIVFTVLGIGLYVFISYFALLRALKLHRPAQTNDGTQDLTDTEDNMDDEREDIDSIEAFAAPRFACE